MSQFNVSSNVIALVHHVELNKTGWWSKALQGFIIATFGNEQNAPISISEIKDLINLNFGIKVDENKIKRQIEDLVNLSRVLCLGNNKFYLSDKEFESFKEDIKNQQIIDDSAKDRFIKIVSKLCPNLDAEEVWERFMEDLIQPLVRDWGVKVIDFVKTSSTLTRFQYIDKFLKKYINDNDSLKEAIVLFFDWEDQSIQDFVYKRLNAYFFAESLNLSDETIKKVYELSKHKKRITLFIDTNFLFSVLGLHENPYNESTRNLLNLINDIKNNIKIEFKILPETVDEFKRKVFNEKITLKQNFRPTNFSLIRLSLSQDVQISSIRKRYFEKCIEKEKFIDPDLYFNPYYDGLSVTLKNHNIEIDNALYEDILDKYQIQIGSDVVTAREYRLKSSRYKSLPKAERELEAERLYDKIDHDVKLWYKIRMRHRNSFYDSPKDINCWIITLDGRFLEYDAYKQKSSVRICIDPNELSGLLQFFIPRSEDLEKSIVSAFKLPFLFKDFDPTDQKITEKILDAISHYEDMTEEVAIQFLTSDLLKEKIKIDNSMEENIALIKEEAIRINKELKEKHEKEVKRSMQLESDLQEIKGLLSLEREVERVRREVESKKTHIALLKNELTQINARLEEYDNIILDKVNKASFLNRLIYSTTDLHSKISQEYIRIIEDLCKQKRNKEDELSKIIKEVHKKETFGIDGQMQGAFFERIIYPLLEFTFPKVRIDRNYKIDNNEYDFVVIDDDIKEVVIIEAKGYAFNQKIKLGDQTTKSSVNWFFRNTFPKAQKHFQEKYPNFRITASFITSVLFEPDALNELETLSKGKLSPSSIKLYVDRPILEEMLASPKLQTEFKDLERFFPIIQIS